MFVSYKSVIGCWIMELHKQLLINNGEQEGGDSTMVSGVIRVQSYDGMDNREAKG